MIYDIHENVFQYLVFLCLFIYMVAIISVILIANTWKSENQKISFQNVRNLTLLSVNKHILWWMFFKKHLVLYACIMSSHCTWILIKLSINISKWTTLSYTFLYFFPVAVESRWPGWFHHFPHFYLVFYILLNLF